MQRYKKIFVTLNPLDRDTAVVRYANLLARLVQPSRIDFVNVVNTKQLPDELVACRPNLLQSAAKRNKRGMRELVKQHFELPAGCEVHLVVLRGSPVEENLDYARSEEPDLLIVGRNPKNSRSGTVPERLTATAPCSVLVIPRATNPALKSILCGIDLSQHSRAVLKQAIALGRAADLKSAYCIHVHDVPDGLRGNDLSLQQLEDLISQHVQIGWRKLLSQVDPDGLKIVGILRRGKFPTLEIKGEVRRSSFDLLIIAARGRSATRNVFLGSVSQRVINATETPLLVIKSKPDSSDFLGAMLEILDRPASQVML